MYFLWFSYGFPMVFYLFRVSLKKHLSFDPTSGASGGRSCVLERKKTWNNKKTVARDIIIYSDGQSLRTYFGKKNLNITAFFTF